MSLCTVHLVLFVSLHVHFSWSGPKVCTFDFSSCLDVSKVSMCQQSFFHQLFPFPIKNIHLCVQSQFVFIFYLKNINVMQFTGLCAIMNVINIKIFSNYVSKLVVIKYCFFESSLTLIQTHLSNGLDLH